MARPEAQSKLLYYPTPESVVELIASHFSATDLIRVADPCCGKGEALKQFAKSFNVPVWTWGVELSYSRAEAAKAVLNQVLPVSLYNLTDRYWSPASVSAIFNNPPYDWSEWMEKINGKERRLRHENVFVERSTPRIVPGGHQVIIIPKGMLGDPAMTGQDNVERMARHLLGWYEQISIARFPDGEYERFKQVVVFAVSKRQKYQPAAKAAIDEITLLADPAVDIPALEVGVGEFIIPSAPTGAKFIYQPINPVDLVRAANVCSPVKTDEFQRRMHVRPLGAQFSPAMPLSVGHLTMLITGQESGVLHIEETGKTVLVKGMSRKVIEAVEVEQTDDKGKVTGYEEQEKERHVATLTVAHPDGKVEMLSDPKSVGDFITAHAEKIADAILERNNPTYDYRPTKSEWHVTGRSALGLPALPGRTEKGLFDMQRHFAIAAARVMQKHGVCIMNAEMGFGKTSTSIAAIELLNEWPALVVCPGHMVWKWKRDLERSCDPDAPIQARVITRPVLDVSGRYPVLLESILAAGGTVEKTWRSQVEPISTNDPGTRRVIEVACTDAGAVASLFNKLNFKDGNVSIPVKVQFTSTGLRAEYVDRDEYTLFDFVADYRSGLLGKKAAAVCGFDPAKYDSGMAERSVAPKQWRRYFDEERGKLIKAQIPTCPACGEGFPKDVPHTCTTCGSPLFEMSRWRRVGLARLVQHKFKNFFRVYIADEIHKAQNGHTDIGAMDQRILSSVKYSLALTGTLFGGAAGSLFFLLYRRVPEIRKLFAFKEKIRWVNFYGLWERSWNQKEPFAGERGQSTGIMRWNYRQREMPGVGPAVIRYLLPITLFGNITDLGFQLPPLDEYVETLEMPTELAEQYSFLQHRVLSEALRIARNGDPGALSTWFAASRFRPASAFRSEVVEYNGKGGKMSFSFPAALPSGGWLPKEEKLAEIVRENMAKGRKTLVFVEQTGTRDIRDRLKLAIETLAPGGELTLVETPRFALRTPRVDVLSAADMAPTKREAWIRTHVGSMDAMLVNPKLIETGLDLVQFATLVFYETTVSLYTLWQAMRRVWRLGQDKDVEVVFLSYAWTVEQSILSRMGAKKKSAQLLYGKEASGVLVEVEDDDIQREIIAAALSGKAIRAPERIERLFTDGTEKKVMVSSSPTGSMVATSPMLTIVELPSGDALQLSLFGEPVPLVRRKRK